MQKNYIWWTLAFFWCIFIFYMSGKPGDESSLDSGFVAQMLNSLAGFLTGHKDIQTPILLIRKTAHFTEYFILGLLLYKSFYRYCKHGTAFLIPAAVGIFYAMTDEIHQYFVPGRAMRIYDVAIDSLGTISAICILYYAGKKKGRSDAA